MEREVFRGEGEVFRDYYYTTSPPAPLAGLADFPADGGDGPGSGGLASLLRERKGGRRETKKGGGLAPAAGSPPDKFLIPILEPINRI